MEIFDQEIDVTSCGELGFEVREELNKAFTIIQDLCSFLVYLVYRICHWDWRVRTSWIISFLGGFVHEIQKIQNHLEKPQSLEP